MRQCCNTCRDHRTRVRCRRPLEGSCRSGGKRKTRNRLARTANFWPLSVQAMRLPLLDAGSCAASSSERSRCSAAKAGHPEPGGTPFSDSFAGRRHGAEPWRTTAGVAGSRWVRRFRRRRRAEGLRSPARAREPTWRAACTSTKSRCGAMLPAATLPAPAAPTPSAFTSRRRSALSAATRKPAPAIPAPRAWSACITRPERDSAR